VSRTLRLVGVMETGSISQFNVLRKCDSKKAKFGTCSHANRVNGVGSVCVPVLRGLVKLDCTWLLPPCSG